VSTAGLLSRFPKARPVFSGYGMGSYSFFNQGVPIYAAHAFEVPANLPAGSLHDLLTIFLSTAGSGGILHVVNDTGGSSTIANPDTPVTVGELSITIWECVRTCDNPWTRELNARPGISFAAISNPISASEWAVARAWNHIYPTRRTGRDELDCDCLRDNGAFVSQDMNMVATGIDKSHTFCIHSGLALGIVAFIGRDRSRRDNDQAMARVRVPAGAASRVPGRYSARYTSDAPLVFCQEIQALPLSPSRSGSGRMAWLNTSISPNRPTATVLPTNPEAGVAQTFRAQVERNDRNRRIEQHEQRQFPWHIASAFCLASPIATHAYDRAPCRCRQTAMRSIAAVPRFTVQCSTLP